MPVAIGLGLRCFYRARARAVALGPELGPRAVAIGPGQRCCCRARAIAIQAVAVGLRPGLWWI